MVIEILVTLVVCVQAFTPVHLTLPLAPKVVLTFRDRSPNVVSSSTSPSSFSSSFSESVPLITTSTNFNLNVTQETGWDDVQNPIFHENEWTGSKYIASSAPTKGWTRLLEALPKRGSDLDRMVLKTAIPSMINLAVVPIVNSVDTFWVGRMGIALALAGQAAANQAFFTLYFLINYLPTLTAPLVASAVGSGNKQAAQQRVCETLFLSNVLGLAGTIFLVGFPQLGLGLVLPPDAPALEYAIPYLRLRSISLIPTLVSATGFAAYRGLLNTVTPLKVSVGANLLNLVLDPILMFSAKMSFVGAALATALAETASGLTYIGLLRKRGLAKFSLIFRPPSLQALMPLIQGGASMLMRQLALNVGFVAATRRAQAIDPTGVTAAGYGIVMQIYSIGIVVHVAMQGTAAALVPATLAKDGRDEARRVADRIFVWGSIVGVLLGITQLLAVPYLVPLFSTLPSVQNAVKVPALLASLLHVINGPVFAGEGVMIGLGKFRDLTLITAGGIAAMITGICSPLGMRLEGIMFSLMVFSALQAAAVVTHHLRFGPLSLQRQ